MLISIAWHLGLRSKCSLAPMRRHQGLGVGWHTWKHKNATDFCSSNSSKGLWICTVKQVTYVSITALGSWLQPLILLFFYLQCHWDCSHAFFHLRFVSQLSATTEDLIESGQREGEDWRQRDTTDLPQGRDRWIDRKRGKGKTFILYNKTSRQRRDWSFSLMGDVVKHIRLLQQFFFFFGPT